MRASPLLVAGGLLLIPATVIAGMPDPLPTDRIETFRINEVTQSRLQAISLFLLVLLLCPLVIRWLWNSLRHDFPGLPRITYGKSLGLVAIWGLMFLVVLTMIAATREMMTPGSWQKQGLLYKVRETSAPASTADALPQSDKDAGHERTASAPKNHSGPAAPDGSP